MPLSLILTTESGMRLANRSDVSRRHLEGMQIAIVDADDFRAGSERLVELFGIVHLNQGGHSVFRGKLAKAPHPGHVEHGCDQQNGVGSMGGGFDHVEIVNREILTQHRDVHRRARGFEIGERSQEKFAIGQNAQCGGAGLRINAGDGGGIEPSRENAFTGRGAFDLGDNRRLARGQRELEIARFAPLGRPLFERRAAGQSFGQGRALAVDNSSEDAGHGVDHAGEAFMVTPGPATPV